MDIAPLHRWPNSPRAAVALQKRLATDICQTPLSRKVQWIGGADAAFSPDGRYVIAAALVWHLPTRSLLESHVVVAPLKFPYVPGLLSFREAPALLRAFAKLEKIPDVVLCDGQGLAHPRRLGLASHLGLWLRIPTIGCAKSRLCGEHRMPARTRGSRTKLVHQAELVGTVVRTRDDVRPLYVSVGNLCTLADAVRLTLACSVGYRMPEPTRLADRIVAKARKDFQNRSPKKRPR